MNFNRHSELEGKHAILGASKYSWLNYDDERAYLDYYDKNDAFSIRCLKD